MLLMTSGLKLISKDLGYTMVLEDGLLLHSPAGTPQ